MGMPSKVDVFASATLFIIMVTNIVLGVTTNVIAYLGVHSRQAGNMTPEDTDFTPSEAL